MSTFASFWDALAALWPLRQTSRQAPIVMGTTTNPMVVPGSSSLTGVIELPGDCDIQIDDWVYWASAAGFPDESDCRISIYYGNDWSLVYPAANPVRVEMIFGTGQRPGRIGYRPWWVETYGNRGLLQMNVSNTATTSRTVELAVRGHRRSRQQG